MNLFIIYRSQALQGLLVFGLGSAVVGFFYLSNLKIKFKKALLGAYVSLTGVSGIFIVLGTLKIGPLASYLYKVSVRQRGFYWNAAWKMMTSNPLTGTGLDSYGDWYFNYRSKVAATLTPTVQSNAAHNVFLDMGAAGGYPLFLLNVALAIFAVFAGIKYIRRLQEFNWAASSLLGGFIAFEAQALISINQIGLAVWGWLFMGALVGLNKKSSSNQETSVEDPIHNAPLKVKRNSRNTKNNSFPYGLLIGGIVGFLVVITPFLNDHNFRVASESRQANAIISATLKSPEDLGRTMQTASLLAQSNLNVQSISLLKHIVSVNPRSFNAWQLLYQISPAGSADHVLAVQKINSLNPQVPAIK